MSIEEGGFTFGQELGGIPSLGSGTSGQSLSSSNSSQQAFRRLVEQILIQEERRNRTTLIITSAFSIAASLIVICMVLWDARTVQKRSISIKKGYVKL
jgi:hypothetical protein